jgi:regulator of nonsense transcripts 1
MSEECQELNALYSQCVDGAIIRIPDRLKSPPPQTTDFIVDILTKRARQYAEDRLVKGTSEEAQDGRDVNRTVDADEQTIQALLSSRRVSMSEFQAIQLAARIARKSWIDMRRYFPLMNFSALGAMEKHAVSYLFDMTTDESRAVWNR